MPPNGGAPFDALEIGFSGPPWALGVGSQGVLTDYSVADLSALGEVDVHQQGALLQTEFENFMGQLLHGHRCEVRSINIPYFETEVERNNPMLECPYCLQRRKFWVRTGCDNLNFM